jgi:pyridoxal phosphate enzyme (YggS family)
MIDELAPEYLRRVRDRLERARERIVDAGGDLDRLQIVAVTKGHPLDAVRAARALGLTAIGENYADELVSKARQIGESPIPDSEIGWHFLGMIQRNKLGRLAEFVRCYHGVDRVEVARSIAARSPGAEILVEVDTTGIAGRGGIAVRDLPTFVARLAGLDLFVRGLMTIAPPGGGSGASQAFSTVRSLADELGLRDCSMGMSDDLELAVSAGSTIVRLGTALFGPRPEYARVSQ